MVRVQVMAASRAATNGATATRSGKSAWVAASSAALLPTRHHGPSAAQGAGGDQSRRLPWGGTWWK
eukprot:9106420-Alexandrium_andersonii.AAC.1